MCEIAVQQLREHALKRKLASVPITLSDRVSISLPKGTLLVLFELLASNDDLERSSTRPAKAQNEFIIKPDQAECRALWQLEAAIERTLPEVFAPDYKYLIGEWKRKLLSESRN